ncbi:MAG: hypothetical protein ACXW4H_05940 [Candidatus Limnocylindrales bacterium]
MATPGLTADGRPGRKVVVWIDHDQAFIVGQGPDGGETVELVDRVPGEGEAEFEARTVGEVVDDEQVVVSGPAYARTDFERAYVALTHRPDRLIDVEPDTRPTSKVRQPA